MTAPLMPRATAVWLVENTTLTFRQIARYCELHELEIQAIADGDVSFNIRGISPIDNGQLTLEEIQRCEADETANIQPNVMEMDVKARNAKAKKVLSPSQRQDKPAAILWIIKNYTTLKDAQICKLIGTTKPTINAIRTGSYKDMSNLKPKNPVTVGLCTEKDIEKALASLEKKANPKKEKVKKEPKKVAKKAVKKSAKKTAKKEVAKKETKKAVAKKTTAKKSAPKKTTAKKVAPKKTTAKKAAPKKTAVKKTVAKKEIAKKITKKAAPKKTTAKKAKKK